MGNKKVAKIPGPTLAVDDDSLSHVGEFLKGEEKR
jgi:hypothetical protein